MNPWLFLTSLVMTLVVPQVLAEHKDKEVEVCFNGYARQSLMEAANYNLEAQDGPVDVTHFALMNESEQVLFYGELSRPFTVYKGDVVYFTYGPLPDALLALLHKP
jgi:hypothetical protein